MKDIKVSIIMPMLNVEQYIRQCIESVIYQTLKEIEIICVDAGSTDGTLEVIQEYAVKDNRIRIINSPIKSYGYQMNLGIDAANGEYIGIVETDDYVDVKMFEELYKLSRNGSIDIIKGNFVHVYDDFSYTDYSRYKLPNKKCFSVFEQPAILNGHPSIWTAIYRRAFLLDARILFEEIPGTGWTDNPFFYESILSANSIIWTAKPYYYYNRFCPTSSTNMIKDAAIPIARSNDILDIIEKMNINDDEILYRTYKRIIHYASKTPAADNNLLLNRIRLDKLLYYNDKSLLSAYYSLCDSLNNFSVKWIQKWLNWFYITYKYYGIRYLLIESARMFMSKNY